MLGKIDGLSVGLSKEPSGRTFGFGRVRIPAVGGGIGAIGSWIVFVVQC